MSSESVCRVARSWVEEGNFHTRLFGVVYFAVASVGEFLDTPSYVLTLTLTLTVNSGDRMCHVTVSFFSKEEHRKGVSGLIIMPLRQGHMLIYCLVRTGDWDANCK
jgi:hypothetical protein